MASAAEEFEKRLLMTPAVVRHRVPSGSRNDNGLVWENLLLSSPLFWHGHVEVFQVPGRLSVLHVCVFPHVDDATPIFGFDMIAGPSKVTGIFLDLTNTIDGVPVTRLRDLFGDIALNTFVERRSLPEWGKVFSPDMLAIRPVSLKEVESAILFGQRALDSVLLNPRTRSKEFVAAISAGQYRYIDAQRQNDHTFKMLAKFIGNDHARRFIDETLFPPIPI